MSTLKKVKAEYNELLTSAKEGSIARNCYRNIYDELRLHNTKRPAIHGIQFFLDNCNEHDRHYYQMALDKLNNNPVPEPIHCTTCGNLLTEDELVVYSQEWRSMGQGTRYRAAMYCMNCRACPDDCRKIPCDLAMREWSRDPEWYASKNRNEG